MPSLSGASGPGESGSGFGPDVPLRSAIDDAPSFGKPPTSWELVEPALLLASIEFALPVRCSGEVTCLTSGYGYGALEPLTGGGEVVLRPPGYGNAGIGY